MDSMGWYHITPSCIASALLCDRYYFLWDPRSFDTDRADNDEVLGLNGLVIVDAKEEVVVEMDAVERVVAWAYPVVVVVLLTAVAGASVDDDDEAIAPCSGPDTELTRVDA